jgi:AcrR family transcriptional regulator
MTSSDTFERARRPEQKRQRQAAILAAARELALQDGVRAVTLTAVATAVGLAKSNVLRYFGTREEIYLSLIGVEWQEWAAEMRTFIGGRRTDGHDISKALAQTLSSRPLFCDLLSVLSTNLEQNITVDAAREFKTVTLTAMEELGEVIAAAHGDLTPDEGAEIAGAATALVRMLWPVANPPEVLRSLYAEDPSLARAYLLLHADPPTTA